MFLYIFVTLSFPEEKENQSRWPHDLSGRSEAAGFLGLRVRNPPLHSCLSVVNIVCCRVRGLCYRGRGVVGYGQMQQKPSTPTMKIKVRLKGKREITILCRSSFNVCIIWRIINI
jgi:hypothetical protein